MDLKVFAMVFGAVFLAEIADKTQLATLAFASKPENPKLMVFLGAALALVVVSAVSVIAGALLSRYMNEKVISWVAGLLFIGVGIWTILRK